MGCVSAAFLGGDIKTRQGLSFAARRGGVAALCCAPKQYTPVSSSPLVLVAVLGCSEHWSLTTAAPAVPAVSPPPPDPHLSVTGLMVSRL